MICTFYSFKGGVGRSMALANVADILSRQGLRVLMIDFDLEAPGLEQYFFTADEAEKRDAIRNQAGLLDLLLAYKHAMSTAGGGDEFRNLDRYVATVFGQRPGGGRLDLLPAGQRLTADQLARYAAALRSFDWQDFYFNWEGDLFFEWLRRALVKRYDLVLIDSRTGVTEMGGICGYQLPDVMVMMCGANHQNVDGTASMVADFRSAPVDALRRGRPLEIVVVPARVEQRTPELEAEFHQRFEERFGALWPVRLRAAGLTSRELTVPYDPQYAFEERVARGASAEDARAHMEGAFGTLADAVVMLAPADVPADCALARAAAAAAARHAGAATGGGAPVIAHYDEAKRFADWDVLVSHAAGDERHALALIELLREHGLKVYDERLDLAAGEEWRVRFEEVLFHSRALVVCLGAREPGEFQRAVVARAIAMRGAARALAVVPVLLPGAGAAPDEALAQFAVVDLREGFDGPHVDALFEALGIARLPARAAPGAATPAVEAEARAPYVGARAYEAHQHDLFWGREREIAQLFEAVQAQPLVLLTGPSGCGKTSLLRAGLLPRLAAAGGWRVALAEGGPGVAASLAGALAGAGPPLASLELALASALAADPAQRVLLVVDHADRLMRSQLVANVERGELATLAQMHGARAHVLIVMRSAFRGELRRLAASESWLAQAHEVPIATPEGEALRTIVARPVDCVGLAFEPGVIDRIMSRADGEPGVLPLLQELLHALWERRRNGWLGNDAYEALGGLRGIVTAAGQRFIDGLDAGELKLARRVLLHTVRMVGGRSAPHPVRIAAMLRNDAGTAANAPLLDMIARLVDARLLVADDDDGEPRLQLAHEALARDWLPLLAWLAEERDFLDWRHRIGAEIEAWERSARAPDTLLRGQALAEAESVRRERSDELGMQEALFIDASLAERERLVREEERRRSMRQKVAVGVASVVSIVACVAAYGWWTAETNRREAIRQAVAAQENLAIATETAQSQREAAEQSLDQLRRALAKAEQVAAQAANAQYSESARRAQAEASARELRLALQKVQVSAERQQKDADRSLSEIRMRAIQQAPLNVAPLPPDQLRLKAAP